MTTRREFIKKMLALGLSSAELGGLLQASACTSTGPLPGVTAPPNPTLQRPADISVTRRPLPAPAPGSTYLAAARGEDAAELTRRAIRAIGGIERFVRPGQTVLIKPNICCADAGPEYALTTNPQVVAALVALCREAGAASVQVMDKPIVGLSAAAGAYETCEIGPAARAAGGEMVLMKPDQFVQAAIPDGQALHECSVYRAALTADVLIDVPVLKHHNGTRLSLAAKNLMGLAYHPGDFHSYTLSTCIVDLCTLLKPTLTVVDAYRILKNWNLTGARLSDVRPGKTIIASHDLVAADAYAAAVYGIAPNVVGYVKEAAARGLGTMDLKSIKIEELA